MLAELLEALRAQREALETRRRSKKTSGTKTTRKNTQVVKKGALETEGKQERTKQKVDSSFR